MKQFIEVGRQFRRVVGVPEWERDAFADLDEPLYDAWQGWPSILEHSRVLVLAEGSAGKTAEMREQCRLLVADGKCAFFVTLEALGRDEFKEVLLGDELRRLDDWKKGDQPAWFFLDSVDELKLTRNRFDTALRRVAKVIEGHLGRARVIVSSRPLDWRREEDMDVLLRYLPFTEPVIEQHLSHEEVFLSVFDAKNAKASSSAALARGTNKSAQTPTVDEVRVVALLPLTRRQIERFVRASNLDDPGAFLAELTKHRAWKFVRRPLDLSNTIEVWRQTRRLGTVAEQHEANVVARLRDDPERADHNVLSDTKARQGAELLALGLTLTRLRSISAPELTVPDRPVEAGMHAEEILQDWTEQERQCLLRRPLFDPGGYGQVRFHHRSVQDYLAARRLHAMRADGMTADALFLLLFPTRYGQDLVTPLLRPVAAWLALWMDDVRRELQRREPETLFAAGDLESLRAEHRNELLRALVARYGTGGWRGLGIPPDQARRIAHHEIGSVVREMWPLGSRNEDVRDTLLDIIWQGRVHDCLDIAKAAARDTTIGWRHRLTGLRAVVECEDRDGIRELLGDIKSGRDRWPDELIQEVTAELYPDLISIDELMGFVATTKESSAITLGYGWTLRSVAKRLDPWSKSAVELRDRLTALVWDSRAPEAEWCFFSSAFSYLTGPLAELVTRQLEEDRACWDNATVRAAIIACRFSRNEVGARTEVEALRVLLRGNRALREQTFWLDFALLRDLLPGTQIDDVTFRATHHSVIGDLCTTDMPWLERALGPGSVPDHRAVALHALTTFGTQIERSPVDVHRWRSCVSDQEALCAILDTRTRPTEPTPELLEARRMHAERERRDRRNERRQRTAIAKWRKSLRENLDTIGTEDNLEQIYGWLLLREKPPFRYDAWNREAIEKAFELQVAERIVLEFRSLWRRKMPRVWSDRRSRCDGDEHHHVRRALCGVSAEADDSRWAERLTPSEARIATALGLCEMNEFPPWLDALFVAHPNVVTSTMLSELDSQLELAAAEAYLPILERSCRATASVKRMIADHLLTLPTWSTPNDSPTTEHLTHHIDCIAQILRDVATTADCDRIAVQCESRLREHLRGPLSLPWLRTLLMFDVERGAAAIDDVLRVTDTRNEKDHLFAFLFADRNHRQAIDLSGQKAKTLGQLLRSATRAIRYEDDQHREGSFTPNERDEAQRARGLLFSSFLKNPDEGTWFVAQELASDPAFAEHRDRLLYVARLRASDDADLEVFTADAASAFQKRYEPPLRTRDGLFAIMCNRLSDLAHDLAHHEFTDRELIRATRSEEDVQKTLARRLHDASRGAYTVTRESEVADKKRTDIWLAATKGDQKAVIEIKIADSWRVAELEEALRDQLVGRYLRHDGMRAGCLLLTHHGRLSWPHDGATLDFGAVLTRLRALALTIEQSMSGAVRLAVVGLSLVRPEVP